VYASWPPQVDSNSRIANFGHNAYTTKRYPAPLTHDIFRMKSRAEVVKLVQDRIRLLHYALSTEDTYCQWVGRYYDYCLSGRMKISILSRLLFTLASGLCLCGRIQAYFPELQPWAGNQGPSGGRGSGNGGQNAYAARIEAENARIDAGNAAGDRGYQALNEGRYKDARQEFLEEIRQNPDFYGGYHLLAKALIYEGNYTDAEYELQQALNQGLSKSLWRDELSFLHRRKANKLLDSSDYAGAEVELRTALNLTPKSAWSWDALGIALANEGKTAEAHAAYEKAVKLDPDPQYKTNLANLLQNQSRAAAVQDLHQSIKSFVQTLTTIAPSGLTLAGDQQTIASGVPFNQSGLTEIPKPKPGNITDADAQLVTADKIAAVHPEQLTVVFDIGGERSAGTLTFPQEPALDPATWPDSVKSAARMVEAWSDLKATGANIDADLEKLVIQRDKEKDTTKAAVLTQQVDLKNQEKQANLLAITKGEAKVKKVRVTIDLVEEKPATTPPAPGDNTSPATPSAPVDTSVPSTRSTHTGTPAAAASPVPMGSPTNTQDNAK
jgi:tetratricopeptide (TPR) repeat protein